MKNLLLISTLLLVSCTQNEPHTLSGLWQDSPNPDFSNCYVSFQVKGDKVAMTHFFHYQGKPFFEVGEGTFKNGVLKYNVEVLQTIDDWATNGYHQLTLSPNGQKLEGFYISSKGQRGPLVFYRR